MDASLMFSTPATPSPANAAHALTAAHQATQTVSAVETSAEPSRPANTPQGRIFAGLMRGLLPTHERQDVAAAAENSSTEPSDLKTEVLGEQINVITTTNALPDPISLSAFAKAQGLDEAAVKALFGELAALGQASSDSAQPTAAMTVITDASSVPVDVAWLASQLSAEISFQISGAKTTTAANSAATAAATTNDAEVAATTGDLSTMSLMGWNLMAQHLPVTGPAVTTTAMPLDPTETPALTVTLPSTASWSTLGLNANTAPLTPLPLTSLPLTPVSLAPVPLAPVPLATTPPPVASQAVMSTTVLNPVVSSALLGTGTLAPTKPSLNTPIAATEGLDLLAPTTPAPQEAMRIRLVPAWSVVTQQLTQMSGTAMTSAWGALTATSLGAPTRTVALDLTTPLTLENEESSSLNGTENGWPSATQDVNRTNAAGTPLAAYTPAPGMAQTLRQEHYQQLADRLGQAMAERLQSQIARGEWKLQMRLNPANLGRIDVELDMHAKGLDAMFRSENPLTRELMVQSMPKLKDTLSQSGMAVASVWVNSDAGRQSDGNPTPQKDRTDVSDTPKSAQTDNGAAPAAKAQKSTDGFDVLA